jgi:hypothetical protein
VIDSHRDFAVIYGPVRDGRSGRSRTANPEGLSFGGMPDSRHASKVFREVGFEPTVSRLLRSVAEPFAYSRTVTNERWCPLSDLNAHLSD